MENKKYNFGEKKEENINGKKIPVEFHAPKYKEAKEKAIELLESKEYKDILKESDFWILVNTYSDKTKAMYSGLILSHDGCLKINDSLEETLKFKPNCVSIDKDGYNGSLVFIYNCPEQGLYEVGEISKNNCKNDYPYAMALKRCFDRVVLKNSKIAYSGIYSDSENDEFKEKEDHKLKENTKTVATIAKDGTKTIQSINKYETARDDLVEYCKAHDIDIKEIAKKYKLNAKSTGEDFYKVYWNLSKKDDFDEEEKN